MVGILCSGQGDQHAEMFARLRRDPVAAGVLNRAVAEHWLEDDVAAWLTSPTLDEAMLHIDRFAQPLLCLYQQAVWAAVSGSIGRVGVFTGLSLGELSAAACAGAMDAKAVVRLASLRAKLMDAASPPGTLVAVLGMDRDAVDSLCRQANSAIAIQMGPAQWTLGCLAGDRDAIIQAALARGAARALPLAVSIASHTPWMNSAVEPFRAALEAAPLSRLNAPVLAGVSARRVWSTGPLIDSLCSQLHTTIRWDLCVESAISSGVQVFLELGPGSALSHTLLARDPSIDARSVTEFSSLAEASAWAVRRLARS